MCYQETIGTKWKYETVVKIVRLLFTLKMETLSEDC